MWGNYYHYNNGLTKKDDFDFNNLTEIAYRDQYRFFSEVRKLGNFKLALIGGQAPVHPSYKEYFTPDFFIEDWRSNIIGTTMPRVYTLQVEYLEKSNCITSTEEKLKIANDITTIYNAMGKCDGFLDGCHPGAKPHSELVELLSSKVFV